MVANSGVAQDHTGTGPHRTGIDTEEDAEVYPMTPRNRPSEGGTVNHAMTESYPLKKAFPDWRSLGSIIGVWIVQLIRTYPVDAGGVVLLR